MEKLHIDIPSETKNIHLVEKFIDNAKQKVKFTDDLYGNVMIAATESVSNAIIHGNSNNKNKKVSISLDIDKNKLRLCVEDEGNGYDYTKLPDPTLPENIEKTGGRGIFLMKNLSDHITFENNGSSVKMEFNIEK